MEANLNRPFEIDAYLIQQWWRAQQQHCAVVLLQLNQPVPRNIFSKLKHFWWKMVTSETK